jgi:ABC-type multidrug transport system fused ATPase/permease subunit
MKSTYYLFLVVIFSLLISLNTYRFFSIEDISIFLTVIGLIYGLIAAFSISNSWEKFSKIRDAIAEETASLKAIYIYSKYLNDKIVFNKIKKNITEYCNEVPKIEWKEYSGSQKTHQKFENLINLVAGIKIKNQKDSELFGEISEELRNAISSRNTQLIISQTKISKTQWLLNIFLSLILIIGLVFLSISNYLLSIFVIASMISSIIFILFVIHEMDSLKIADTEVYVNPYIEVLDLINKG